MVEYWKIAVAPTGSGLNLTAGIACRHILAVVRDTVGGVVCRVDLPYGKQGLRTDTDGYSPFSL